MKGVKYFFLALSSVLLMNYSAHAYEMKVGVNTKVDGSVFRISRGDIIEYCLAVLWWVDEVRIHSEGQTPSGLPNLSCLGRIEEHIYGPSPVNFHSICRDETGGEQPIARPYYEGEVICDDDHLY